MEYKPIEKKYWTPEVKMKISAPGVICFSAWIMVKEDVITFCFVN
jgi:hypothetical protein